ncbi:unnamed protein product [marine sediment metagenome]|uniref:Uncharacterized protein n=1 Tax=marine sediment metagenome TaxID=412755 RepID=X0SPY2_9ZZZZ
MTEVKRKYIKKIDKEIKMPKYNVKYVNNEGTILFEDDFFKLQDCIEPLKLICPLISKRRLNIIREKNTTDKLAPFIHIINRTKII